MWDLDRLYLANSANPLIIKMASTAFMQVAAWNTLLYIVCCLWKSSCTQKEKKKKKRKENNSNVFRILIGEIVILEDKPETVAANYRDNDTDDMLSFAVNITLCSSK